MGICESRINPSYIILVLICSAMVFGCNRVPTTEGDSETDFTQNRVAKAQLSEYAVNPFTGDSIQPIINRKTGELLETGKPLRISPSPVSPHFIENYLTLTLNEDSEFRTKSDNGTFELIKYSKSPTIDREWNSLKDIDQNTVLVNSIGDTITLGLPKEIEPITLQITQSKPLATKPWHNSELTNYPITYMGVNDDLPTSDIKSFLIDSKGTMWIGSAIDGLIKYDGSFMQRISKEEGFPAESITSIAEDQSGNIWIGTRFAGLIKFDGENFYQFNESLGLSSNYIYDISCDENGTLWIGTNGGGLIKHQDETFTHFVPSPNPHSKRIYQINSNNPEALLLSTIGGGLIAFKDGYYKLLSDDNPNTPGKVVLGTPSAGDGRYWISESEKISLYDGEGFDVYRPKDEDNIQLFHTSSSDQHGNLWTATSKGLTKLSPDGKYYPISVDYEYIPINTSQINVRDNKVLFSNSNSGLYSLNLDRPFNLDLEKENDPDKIESMFEMSNGDRWFGTVNSGLILTSKDKKYKYNLSEQLGVGEIFFGTFYAEDANHNLWIATATQGLGFKKHGGSTIAFLNLDKQNNFTKLSGSALTIDSNGKIWVGTMHGGIYIKDGDEVSKINMNHGLGSNFITSFCETEDGTMWIGTYGGGLSKFRNGELTVYSEKEGLPENAIINLAKGNEGLLWASTESKGVFSISTDGKISSIQKKDGLIDNRTSSIITDALGDVWVSTLSGISQISIDTTGNVLTENYDDKIGLKDTRFKEGKRMITADSTLFWINNSDVVAIKPKPIRKLKVKAPNLKFIEINERYLDFKNDSTSKFEGIEFEKPTKGSNIPENLTLHSNISQISAHFAVGANLDAAHINYSFKLLGNNKYWSEPKPNAQIEYNGLNQGTYTLLARAQYDDGPWSETTSFSFKISPPWYRAWWMIGVYMLGLIGLGYLIFLGRMKQKLQIADAKRLLELNQMKNQFFTNISHEFRTPLTLIGGMVDTLPDDFESRNKQHFDSKIDILNRNSKDLLNLVNQLLELSKLDSGKVEFNPVNIDLGNYLQRLCSMYTSVAENKGLKLNCDIPVEKVFIHADENAVNRIFINLLSNAIKFTNHGSIDISLKTKSNTAIVEVKDTGQGIPQKDIQHIFNRFYQVDNSDTRHHEGTGVGLSLAYELIKAHKGGITVNSSEGKGATFKVTLPKVEVSKTEHPTEDIVIEKPISVAMPMEDNQDELNEKEIILVVDDNIDIQTYLKNLLQSDYRIITAENGVVGAEKAKEITPDFIITDWMMPNTTGPQMISQLKKDASTSHIPVMLLTGKADQESKISGLKVGAEAYLAKPFEPDELRFQIKSLIEARKKIRDYITKDLPIEEAPIVRFDSEREFLEKTKLSVIALLSDENLDGELLAEIHHLSRSQFARKLKAISGMSVTQYLRSIRINHAKKMLLEGKLSISEVAYEVGFSDPSYFTRVVTKEVGKSPSAFAESA